jgi:hypothetical protein
VGKGRDLTYLYMMKFKDILPKPKQEPMWAREGTLRSCT